MQPLTPVRNIKEDSFNLDMRAFYDIPHRDIGSADSRRAQVHIARRFFSLGLKPFGPLFITPFSFKHTEAASFFLPATHKHPSAANVIGYIPGSARPERFIVVSTHYDTYLAPSVLGSHREENRSGVAAMLEIAAYLARHPPLNSVVFAAFDGGEHDYGGARAFLASEAAPARQIAVNLHLGDVASPDVYYLYVLGASDTPGLDAILSDVLKESPGEIRASAERAVSTSHLWGIAGQSDHQVFHEHGIPYLFVKKETRYETPKSRKGVKRKIPGLGLPRDEMLSFLIDLTVHLDQNLDILPRRRQ